MRTAALLTGSLLTCALALSATVGQPGAPASRPVANASASSAQTQPAQTQPLQTQPAPTQPGQTARGTVYEDKNGNGVRDQGEPGVGGVSVSNGRAVVQTDGRGEYRLPVDDETIIFVTKPAGYMVPVDENRLPQHYYIHYPNGTPMPLEFGGIAPTGPLPASVDFPLVKQKESKKFDVVVFADPQADSERELDYIRDDVVAELAGVNAAFGITVGDVVNDNLTYYGRMNNIVSSIGLPWWNLPGNHDMNYDVPDDTYATETFKRVFGPTYYSFDYGQAHFVNLDNVEYRGGRANNYRGNIPAEQLEWLKNDLAMVPKNKLVVLSTHIPLRTYAGNEEGINTANLRDLFAVFQGREFVYSMSGHDTSNTWQMYMGPEEGWTGATPFHHQVLAEVRGGSWRGPVDSRGIPAADTADGTPNGYYILSIDGNKYSTRFKAASLPADFQARVTIDAPGAEDGRLDPAEWQGTTPTVVANVFDGGARHKVEIKVDGGEFAPMTQTTRTDPYMVAQAAQYKGTPEAPDTPAATAHIWTRPLPAGLAPGVHTITVRSTDPFGKVNLTSRVFEMVGA